MTLQRFRVAALQMVSAPEVDANLRRAEALIAEAAAAGAQLVTIWSAPSICRAKRITRKSSDCWHKTWPVA